MNGREPMEPQVAYPLTEKALAAIVAWKPLVRRQLEAYRDQVGAAALERQIALGTILHSCCWSRRDLGHSAGCRRGDESEPS